MHVCTCVCARACACMHMLTHLGDISSVHLGHCFYLATLPSSGPSSSPFSPISAGYGCTCSSPPQFTKSTSRESRKPCICPSALGSQKQSLLCCGLFLEESLSPLSLPFCSSYDVTHFLCGVFTSFTGPRPFSHLHVFACNWVFPCLSPWVFCFV